MIRNLSISIFFLSFINLAAAGTPGSIPPLEPTMDSIAQPPPVPLDNCQMTEACPYPAYNINSLAAGNRIVTYFDPEIACNSPAYPFEITTLWITFNDQCNPCVQWPFPVDLVVYNTAPSRDPCLGPGTEIYRESYSCDEANYKYPNIGPLFLSSPLCVDGPFFIGIEYTGQPFGLYPPIMIGDAAQCPPVDCHHWGGYADHWWQWNTYWGMIVGAPAFWVDGETGSSVCAPQQEVPALSEWGMLILGLLLLTIGSIAAVRGKNPALKKAA